MSDEGLFGPESTPEDELAYASPVDEAGDVKAAQQLRSAFETASQGSDQLALVKEWQKTENTIAMPLSECFRHEESIRVLVGGSNVQGRDLDCIVPLADIFRQLAQNFNQCRKSHDRPQGKLISTLPCTIDVVGWNSDSKENLFLGLEVSVAGRVFGHESVYVPQSFSSRSSTAHRIVSVTETKTENKFKQELALHHGHTTPVDEKTFASLALPTNVAITTPQPLWSVADAVKRSMSWGALSVEYDLVGLLEKPEIGYWSDDRKQYFLRVAKSWFQPSNLTSVLLCSWDRIVEEGATKSKSLHTDDKTNELYLRCNSKRLLVLVRKIQSRLELPWTADDQLKVRILGAPDGATRWSAVLRLSVIAVTDTNKKNLCLAPDSSSTSDSQSATTTLATIVDTSDDDSDEDSPTSLNPP